MKPEMDLRKFRFSRLNDPEFRHLKLLVYWPLFGAVFWFLERFSPITEYHTVYCALDEYIPFLEIFLLPYLFWFVYLIGMHIYTAIYDVASFRYLMRFVIISYTVTAVIYILYPTCQEFRPEVFPRDNALTRFIDWFYEFDTHTNVCPSLHVAYSIGIASVWTKEKGASRAWKVFVVVAVILICLSTMFIKQHSAVDFFAALPVCLLAEYIVYGRRKKAP